MNGIYSPRPFFEVSFICDKFRPDIKIKTSKNRSEKNRYYAYLKLLAINNNIRGNMLTLGANHVDHIIAELSPQVTSVTSCEIDKRLAIKLINFYDKVNTVYKDNNLGLTITKYNIDIFEFLSKSDYQPFSFLDFDFNSVLNEGKIKRMIELVPERVEGSSILSLWNSYGRENTLIDHEKLISILIGELKNNLDVQVIQPIKYSENMPMFLQILILKEK